MQLIAPDCIIFTEKHQTFLWKGHNHSHPESVPRRR